LYGVIEHTGTLRSGHYTAYVKLRPHAPPPAAAAHSDDSPPGCLQFLQTLPPCRMSVGQLVDKLRSVSEQQTAASSTSSSSSQLSDADNQQQCGTALSSDDVGGRWFHISDTSVAPVKLSSVLRCQAYILFYERIA